MKIEALEPGDTRAVVAEVAGVAALLVAKAHKIHDRIESNRSDRLSDKDASDVVRLMQTTSPTDVAERLAQLAIDRSAGAVTQAATGYINELFGRRGAVGIDMASRAMRGAIPPERVEAVCIAYARILRNAASGRH